MSEKESETAMSSSVALKTAKKELRSLMKQKLLKLPLESIISQSATLFQKITTLKGYQDSKRLGIYLSMPTGEIQTDAIVRHALGSGKQVFVPYLHKSPNPSPDTPISVMDMIDLRSLSDYDSLKRDSWGIPTIGADTLTERDHILGNSKKQSHKLDLILMPGVAFDVDPETGFVRRLGHGKGFYDYFLHRYQQIRGTELRDTSRSPGTDILFYGLALEEQFLQVETEHSVPVGQHDHSLHGLLVGDGQMVEGPFDRMEPENRRS